MQNYKSDFAVGNSDHKYEKIHEILSDFSSSLNRRTERKERKKMERRTVEGVQ